MDTILLLKKKKKNVQLLRKVKIIQKDNLETI